MLKLALIIAAAAGLSGCGGPSLSKNQRAEVENIAEDFADGAASDATANVDNSEIESKIDNLESRMADMDNEIDRLRKQNLEDANAAADLERRINELQR
jgi:chromosome segregation ATPase